MTQDQIDARVLQIAEDLRIARNLAEQEDVDALWRTREEEDRLAAERAGRQAAARPRSPASAAFASSAPRCMLWREKTA